jgi:hypothetical protein
MGDVVSFPHRKPPASSRVEPDSGKSAQILFFTGVRYQRMAEATPPKASGGHPSSEGGKRRRKRG